MGVVLERNEKKECDGFEARDSLELPLRVTSGRVRFELQEWVEKGRWWKTLKAFELEANDEPWEGSIPQKFSGRWRVVAQGKGAINEFDIADNMPTNRPSVSCE